MEATGMLLDDAVVAPYRRPKANPLPLYESVQRVVSDPDGQFADLYEMFEDERLKKAPFVQDDTCTMYRNFQRLERLRLNGGAAALSPEEARLCKTRWKRMGRDEREAYDPAYRRWAKDQVQNGGRVGPRLFRKHQRERGITKVKPVPKNPTKVNFIKSTAEQLTALMHERDIPSSERFRLQNELWVQFQKDPDSDPFSIMA